MLRRVSFSAQVKRYLAEWAVPSAITRDEHGSYRAPIEGKVQRRLTARQHARMRRGKSSRQYRAPCLGGGESLWTMFRKSVSGFATADKFT